MLNTLWICKQFRSRDPLRYYITELSLTLVQKCCQHTKTPRRDYLSEYSLQNTRFDQSAWFKRRIYSISVHINTMGSANGEFHEEKLERCKFWQIGKIVRWGKVVSWYLHDIWPSVEKRMAWEVVALEHYQLVVKNSSSASQCWRLRSHPHTSSFVVYLRILVSSYPRILTLQSHITSKLRNRSWTFVQGIRLVGAQNERSREQRGQGRLQEKRGESF